jgi:hypothetical protein
MSFYDLSKDEREKHVEKIHAELFNDLKHNSSEKITQYFSDEDTYIRKSAYIAIGRIYFSEEGFQKRIINILEKLFNSENYRIRQTVVNAAGEIGVKDFNAIVNIMELGLFDKHHSPRNAVIGSIKKMAEKNPVPALRFADRFLLHEDYEIRREICHGIELRGRTHPGDVLPLLRKLEFDTKPRVRNTLIHVIGQIAYKKGCLQIVAADLKKWKNKELVAEALLEIIDVHERYKNFAAMTKREAENYIEKYYN